MQSINNIFDKYRSIDTKEKSLTTNTVLDLFKYLSSRTMNKKYIFTTLMTSLLVASLALNYVLAGAILGKTHTWLYRIGMEDMLMIFCFVFLASLAASFFLYMSSIIYNFVRKIKTGEKHGRE